MGRSLTYGVYTHGEGVFPNSRQIDHYMVIPICVTLALAVFAWIFNGLRSAQPLVAISIISLVALLPYLFGYTGGM
jgi:phosphoglycerol transferase MdoB-like AlkP superfamily enzyme